MFSERAESRSQDFAIKAILAAEVVIDGSLIDPRLGDDGADTRSAFPWFESYQAASASL